MEQYRGHGHHDNPDGNHSDKASSSSLAAASPPGAPPVHLWQQQQQGGGGGDGGGSCCSDGGGGTAGSGSSYSSSYSSSSASSSSSGPLLVRPGDCPICLEEYDVSSASSPLSPCLLMPCGHAACASCAATIMQHKNNKKQQSHHQQAASMTTTAATRPWQQQQRHDNLPSNDEEEEEEQGRDEQDQEPSSSSTSGSESEDEEEEDDEAHHHQGGRGLATLVPPPVLLNWSRRHGNRPLPPPPPPPPPRHHHHHHHHHRHRRRRRSSSSSSPAGRGVPCCYYCRGRVESWGPNRPLIDLLGPLGREPLFHALLQAKDRLSRVRDTARAMDRAAEKYQRNHQQVATQIRSLLVEQPPPPAPQQQAGVGKDGRGRGPGGVATTPRRSGQCPGDGTGLAAASNHCSALTTTATSRVFRSSSSSSSEEGGEEEGGAMLLLRLSEAHLSSRMAQVQEWRAAMGNTVAHIQHNMAIAHKAVTQVCESLADPLVEESLQNHHHHRQHRQAQAVEDGNGEGKKKDGGHHHHLSGDLQVLSQYVYEERGQEEASSDDHHRRMGNNEESSYIAITITRRGTRRMLRLAPVLDYYQEEEEEEGGEGEEDGGRQGSGARITIVRNAGLRVQCWGEGLSHCTLGEAATVRFMVVLPSQGDGGDGEEGVGTSTGAGGGGQVQRRLESGGGRTFLLEVRPLPSAQRHPHQQHHRQRQRPPQQSYDSIRPLGSGSTESQSEERQFIGVVASGGRQEAEGGGDEDGDGGDETWVRFVEGGVAGDPSCSGYYEATYVLRGEAARQLAYGDKVQLRLLTTINIAGSPSWRCVVGGRHVVTFVPKGLVLGNDGQSPRQLSLPPTAGPQLNMPESVTVTGRYVMVSDCWNHRVLILGRQDGRMVAVLGEEATSGGALRSPTGLAVDETDSTIYVADTHNHRIQVFAMKDRQTGNEEDERWEWTGTLGTSGESGCDDHHFHWPTSVALLRLSPSRVLLLVTDFKNDRVTIHERIATTSPAAPGSPPWSWRLVGVLEPPADRPFSGPTQVAIGPPTAAATACPPSSSSWQRRVYVVDSHHHHIQTFTCHYHHHHHHRDHTASSSSTGPSSPPSVGVVSFVPLQPSPALGVRDCPGSGRGGGQSLLCQPYGLCLSPDGSIVYVGDSKNKRVVAMRAEDGAFLHAYYAASAAPPRHPSTHSVGPCGVALSPEGDALYTADYRHSRILIWSGQRAAPTL